MHKNIYTYVIYIQGLIMASYLLIYLVLGWLKEEKEVMFVTRLRQLAASKCDDLALLLTSAVMIRARDCTTAVSDIDQAAGITGIYIVSVYY